MQALWMLVAAFAFALMGVCVKFASGYFTTAELVCYRGLIGVLMMGVLARLQSVAFATQVPAMHLWRSIVGVISLSAWFYAIAHLPLATAMTLNYMSSVWVAAFLLGGAVLVGKAQPQNALFATVLVGFAGVVLVLRPAFETNQLWPGLIGLMSGMTAALAYLQVTAMARAGEPDARVVFYFAVASALLGGLGMVTDSIWALSPSRSGFEWRLAIWILPIGVLASLGQLCMTRAYASGATLLVANLQYSGIVFGAVFSLLIFNDHLPPLAWLGMALIIASGLAATALRRKALPQSPD